MNEHIKKCHPDRPGLSAEDFDKLERATATQSGPKNSYIELSATPLVQDDFRSESLLESRLGLLKSCIFYDEEEEACLADSALFVKPAQKVLWDTLFAGVLAVFARADFLCRQIGSTQVRHQMMRDEKGKVSAKVFHPVTQRTAHRYAYYVRIQKEECSMSIFDSVVIGHRVRILLFASTTIIARIKQQRINIIKRFI
jgi:hypothetical protein